MRRVRKGGALAGPSGAVRRMRAGVLGGVLLLPMLALMLATKAAPGRTTGGPSGTARPPSAAKYVERYPERENDVPPTLEQLARPRVYDLDPAQGIGLDTFTLWALDDLGRPDPSAYAYLRLTGRKLENGDYHLVVHVTKAPALTNLQLVVRYDQDNWHPRNCDPGSLFGKEGDRLWLCKLDVPGVVCAAIVRIRPDVNGGTKVDDGVVCEMAFNARPFDYKPWWPDNAPGGARNQPRNVQAYMDPQSCCVVLYWEEANLGDYNNDGEVGLGDLVPVGYRYGRLSTDGFEDEWDRLVDGNADGEINRRDVWLIAENFGALLSGYRVYRRPAGRPKREEVLLKHRTSPLLPLSVHRPVEWDPARPIAYRYYDRDVTASGKLSEWIYRIVPYDAADDREGPYSDIEVKVRAGPGLVSLASR